MKYLIYISLLFSYNTLFAQQSLDFQDTRNKKESFAKLQDKGVRFDLAGFTLSGIDESIGKSEMKKLPYTKYGNNYMTFEGDGMKATVTTDVYIVGKHRLDFDEKNLIKIDRKTYYGGYGSVPVTYIKNITMVLGGDSVVIPPSAYVDLYNLNFAFRDKQQVDRSANGIYRSRDGQRIYLYLFCKDQTGSYEVTFVIQNKKYAYRVLDYGFM